MDLRRVDLNLLVAFDALMQERSVTRAASRLYIGQSAMSATLARLRVLFDDPILIRQGRQVVPTPVADALVEPVRRALEMVGGILTKRSSFDPAVDHRTFTIIASDYLTFNMFRMAAIFHGIKARMARGTATSARAKDYAAEVEWMAAWAWKHVQ